MSELREKLAEVEHLQWESWAVAISIDLEKIRKLIKERNPRRAMEVIDLRLNRWKAFKVPYAKLGEEAKNLDRQWADKVMRVLSEDLVCMVCLEQFTSATQIMKHMMEHHVRHGPP